MARPRDPGRTGLPLPRGGVGNDGGMHLEPFLLTAVILVLVAVAGVLALRLRQPLLVAFLAVGILLGPSGLDWISAADETVALLAELGVAILLFLVGLRLDLHLVRATGPVAVIVGLAQMLLTAAMGLGVGLVAGLDAVAATYLAIAVAFSSTVIVVKLLSDSHEIEQLHGRIAVGILIVQDVAVIVVLIALTAVGGRGEADVPVEVLLVVVKGLGLVAGVALFTRFLLSPILRQVARSPELLMVFGVAYALAAASASEALAFGAEVGAFLAGVSLASTPFRDGLGARLASLRDFLLMFFFLDLGAGLALTDIRAQLLTALVVSLLVLVGKPLVVLVGMTALRYRTRTAFLTGLSLAQISEFSLVLAAVGLGLGHVDREVVGLITMVGLITFAGSAYLISFSRPIHRLVEPWLRGLERDRLRGEPLEQGGDYPVILFGLGRFGGHLADELGAGGHAVLAVDHDPRRVAANEREGVDAVFGSADDLDFLESLPLAGARHVISTLPAVPTSRALLDGLRARAFEGRVAVTAHTRRDADLLRDAGADLVLEPFDLAARGAARTVRVVGLEGRVSVEDVVEVLEVLDDEREDRGG